MSLCIKFSRPLAWVVVFFLLALVGSKWYLAWYDAQQHLHKRLHDHLVVARSLPRAQDLDVASSQYLKRHAVYVTMSTLPERIGACVDVLSVLDLTHVHTVFLNLPKKLRRSNQAYMIPPALLAMEKVKIQWLDEDWGPISKVYPTLRAIASEDSDAIIVVLDDDMIYPPGTVNQYIKALVTNPKAAHATMPAKLVQADALPPFSYDVSHHLLASFEGHEIKLVHGVGSYALTARQLDLSWLFHQVERFKNEPIDERCVWSDDLLISVALARKHTPVALVDDPALSYRVLKAHPFASRQVQLHHPMSWHDRFRSIFLRTARSNLTNERLYHCSQALVSQQ